jgi:hypothetical protein
LGPFERVLLARDGEKGAGGKQEERDPCHDAAELAIPLQHANEKDERAVTSLPR